MTRQADEDQERFVAVIRTATRYRLREADQALEAEHVQFRNQVEQTRLLRDRV